MSEFLYICEYLGVTPQEFFDEDCDDSSPQQKAINYIRSMYDEDANLILKLFERMK